MIPETNNPIAVEGTPERAADRGRAQDLGFAPTSKPSLADPKVVHGIMAEFGSDVVSIRKRFNQNKLTGDGAKAELRDLAKRFGGIIMGADERYHALPWHSPRSLGRAITKVVPAVEGVEDPGELLFLVVGTSIIDLARAHEEERVSDQQAEQHARSTLDDTAALILGVR